MRNGWSEKYDEELARGLVLTGDDKGYFALRRVKWLAGCLQTRDAKVESVVDFGCGIGGTVPILNRYLAARRLVGIDVVPEALQSARTNTTLTNVSFALRSDIAKSQDFDVVYCNGVFHHLSQTQRLHTVQSIRNLLRPGGYFALWENNPYNPGTRLVMSRIHFDSDARLLTPGESKNLLRRGGFDVLQVDYHFYFPRALSLLRPIEPWLVKVPAGGQYQILARKRG